MTNFNVFIVLSYGGPRNDRQFTQCFETTVEFRNYVFRQFCLSRLPGAKFKSVSFYLASDGVQLAFIGSNGLQIETPVGPIFFDENFSVSSFFNDITNSLLTQKIKQHEEK